MVRELYFYPLPQAIVGRDVLPVCCYGAASFRADDRPNLGDNRPPMLLASHAVVRP